MSDWSQATPDPESLGLGHLATALRTLLVVAAMLAGAVAFLAVRLGAALDDVNADGSGGGARQHARDAFDAFFGGATVYFLALALIGVLFVTWMWRLARNNQAFGRPGALGRGWAIGGWFIPVAGLVIPVVQMQQLWRGADGSVPRGDAAWRQVPRSGRVWAWWGAYVSAQLLTLFGFRLLGQTDDPGGTITVDDLVAHLDDVDRGITLFVVGQAVMVLAAGLAATMVMALTRRQEAAANVLGASGADAAWRDDPTGRFEQRYWDGQAWTEHVSSDGRQDTDPV